jgi:hypothetical protein
VFHEKYAILHENISQINVYQYNQTYLHPKLSLKVMEIMTQEKCGLLVFNILYLFKMMC